MSKRNLTPERLHQVLHYDPKTGEFFRRINSRRRPNSLVHAGTKTVAGYIAIYVDGYHHTAHRLAWLYTKFEWPKGDIDHINGNRQDNRISNLRDATRLINSQNKRSPIHGKQSGLPLGVSRVRRDLAKPFFAAICHNEKSIHLGYFSNAEEAHDAYLKAKRSMHEGCTI
jgi:hypothetical protein